MMRLVLAMMAAAAVARAEPTLVVEAVPAEAGHRAGHHLEDRGRPAVGG